AVVPLRAPSAPSDARREATRRATRSAARDPDGAAERLPQATIDEARARIMACPEAARGSCREAVVRDIVTGAAWARRPGVAAFRPPRAERLLGP
ncbi:MAG TPA: hypothetical protein VFS00_18015, partial [Polyangiaceae bacterium]|nr:hypothetical protein [Polyangiaceae bacterium]